MRKYLVMVLVAAVAAGAYAQPAIQEGTREVLIDGSWDPDGPTGTVLDLTFGYGVFVRDAIEVGGQIGYSSTEDAGGVGVDSKTLWLGGFVDYHFDMGTMTVPYVGADISYGNRELGTWDESAFVYGPHVGVKHFITENVAVNIALQYLLATEDVFTNDGTLEDNDLSLEFGIRVMF